MNNSLKCQRLFAFNSVFFKNLFSEYTYPWDILPELKDLIDNIIRVGIGEYTLFGDRILIGKNVRISPSAYIKGPTIISDNCEIRHGAFIRGSVILGKGCVVGNSSELKNCILMDRAQAPHFNYVGDSVLGEGAHLGAGAICSNLRSDGKNVLIRTESEAIDTGRRKLGAILADGAEIGCGAVLCPGTVIGMSTTVYPLIMTRGVYPANSIVKSTYEVISKA